MKEYSYKDSRIEWLEEIPEHWILKRLGALGHFSKGGGIAKADLVEDGLDAILYGDIYTTYDVKAEEIKNKIDSEVAESSKQIFPGDLLFTGSGETIKEIGKCIVFEGKKEAYAGGDLIIFRQKKYDSLFLSYVLNSELGIHQKARTAKGDIVVHTYASKLKNIYLPLPPLPEQRAIADYLDAACQKIDRVIELKEKQIEKIEKYFKNRLSELMTVGIEESVVKETKYPWIESVNESWKIKPLKRLLEEKLTYGANESAEEENVDHPRYIRITDFDGNGFLRNGTFKSLSPELAKPYLLEEGDVLFARSGATVGKTFIFKNYQGEACFAGYLIRARTKKSKLIPEYLYYFTKSNVYDEWKNLIFTQSTIQNIGADKYQYLPIPIPNADEQKEIVQQIENLWNLVDNQKGKLLRQIGILKNYRKSLIHECVTGKKQVFDGKLEYELVIK